MVACRVVVARGRLAFAAAALPFAAFLFAFFPFGYFSAHIFGFNHGVLLGLVLNPLFHLIEVKTFNRLLVLARLDLFSGLGPVYAVLKINLPHAMLPQKAIRSCV